MSEINSEVKVNRLQTLKAMERVMITTGGKDGLIAWLNAMPEDAVLSAVGCVSHNTMVRVAEDDAAYRRAVRAFASHMAPVLTALAEEV